LSKACGLSLEKYPRLKAWFERCKLTFYNYDEVNGEGTSMIAQFILPKLTKGF
jgi:hypothetical protein